tara:strand:- start:643 stop:1116 length:474 start_codon:yes stop_codon:yes gene_type:complete
MNTQQIQAVCSKIAKSVFLYKPGNKIPTDCDVVIVEKNSRESLNSCHKLKVAGWKIFKGDSGYAYVKNDDVLNALKNPKNEQIALEKPSEKAIIDTANVEILVGTTPDPSLLFVEEEDEAETERARDEAGKFVADDPETPDNEAWVKKTYKSEKKKW